MYTLGGIDHNSLARLIDFHKREPLPDLGGLLLNDPIDDGITFQADLHLKSDLVVAQSISQEGKKITHSDQARRVDHEVNREAKPGTQQGTTSDTSATKPKHDPIDTSHAESFDGFASNAAEIDYESSKLGQVSAFDSSSVEAFDGFDDSNPRTSPTRNSYDTQTSLGVPEDTGSIHGVSVETEPEWQELDNEQAQADGFLKEVPQGPYELDPAHSENVSEPTDGIEKLPGPGESHATQTRNDTEIKKQMETIEVRTEGAIAGSDSANDYIGVSTKTGDAGGAAQKEEALSGFGFLDAALGQSAEGGTIGSTLDLDTKPLSNDLIRSKTIKSPDMPPITAKRKTGTKNATKSTTTSSIRKLESDDVKVKVSSEISISVNVTLKLGDTGTGIAVIGPERGSKKSDCHGVFVSEVKKGSCAESEGSVKVGMRVMKVNGQDTTLMTCEEVATILNVAPVGKLTLSLVDDPIGWKKQELKPASTKPSAEGVRQSHTDNFTKDLKPAQKKPSTEGVRQNHTDNFTKAVLERRNSASSASTPVVVLTVVCLIRSVSELIGPCLGEANECS